MQVTRLIVVAMITIAVLAAAYTMYPEAPGDQAGRGGIACYWLQNITQDKAGWHNWTVAIVEPTETGQDALATLKQHSGLVLAYINAGYAEEWRPYWPDAVEAGIVHGPTEYEGEYYVEYWSTAWKQILLDTALEYLAQGYDGIYLDNMDASTYLDELKPDWANGVDPYNAMIELVDWLSKQVRSLYPEAQVYVNIGSSLNLLDNKTFVDAIDGVLREEVWTTWAGDNETAPMPPEETQTVLYYLKKARTENLTVIIVDPATIKEEADNLCAQAHHEGFIPIPQPAWDPDYTTPPPPDWCR